MTGNDSNARARELAEKARELAEKIRNEPDPVKRIALYNDPANGTAAERILAAIESARPADRARGE